MTPPIAIFLMFAFSLCLAGAAHAQPPSDWVEHRNDRYGFSLKYPSDVFKTERTTEAGDGQALVSEDGQARLLVGVLINDSGFTAATYQDHVARASYGRFKIIYRPLREGWFALSGEGDGKIFYEKVIFSCSGRLINSFAMIYPASRRAVFDPIVEKIEDTFRAGKECERAGLAPAKSARQPFGTSSRRQTTTAHRRSPFQSASRSRLADWIARKRGQDVYVILQRTSPPYDRKVVRGYVSR